MYSEEKSCQLCGKSLGKLELILHQEECWRCHAMAYGWIIGGTILGSGLLFLLSPAF